MSTRIKLHISQRPVRDASLVVVTRLICRVTLAIRAHLAHTDEIPQLIGFSGLLDRADVCFSVNRSEAYLEI